MHAGSLPSLSTPLAIVPTNLPPVGDCDRPMGNSAATFHDMPHGLPILPTTVVGSYAHPSWFYGAKELMEAGRFGPVDIEMPATPVKIWEFIHRARANAAAAA